MVMHLDGVDDDLLIATFDRLFRRVRRLASAGGLSTTAAAVLTRLVEDGPQRVSDLAAAESLSQPGMTQLVHRLENQQLVVRTQPAHDRRVCLVEVTATGQALVRARQEQRREGLLGQMDRLGTADREAILAAVPALNRLLDLG